MDTTNRPKTFITNADVSLSHEEWLVSVATLAAKSQELRDVEAEKTATTAGFGTRIKQIREDMKTADREVITRKGEREVEVYENRDAERGIIEIIRVDNGEVVRTMGMSAGEKMAARQRALPVVDEEPSPTADGGRPGQKLTRQKRKGTLPEEMDDRVGE